ncbi:MAG TPA: TerC family protein [Candidatus Paceibacterota bacterium]|nr:TerC family protein [Candidatus Paceibacterota bacterium]
MEWITNPEIWVSLLTLTLLEIILGIDNIVFISILAGKLPADQQAKARKVGLSLALITRILLLCSLAWMMKLTAPLFHIPAFALLKEPHGVSGRDLILILGGLFLLWKSTHEIHDKLEGEEGEASGKTAAKFVSTVIQILLLDIVFSLDSVITAIGMAKHLEVMIAAVVIALLFMLALSGRLSDFIHRHPSLKMLALSFLLLIGCALVAEGFHKEIPKGYIYFAMAFSVGVESLNIRMRTKKAKPVELHQQYP